MGVKSIVAGSLALAMLLAVTEQGCSTGVQTASEASSSVSSATAGSGGQGTASGTGGGPGGGPSGTGVGGTATGGATATATATSGTGGADGCVGIRKCQAKIYECGDGIDNDGDGLIDSDDPDCLGVCDNTEDSFDGYIPGQSGGVCGVDCYFDGDTGPGNDDCNWSHSCDPHEVPPYYHPESIHGSSCEYDPATQVAGVPMTTTCADLHDTQSPQCHAVCGPLVPNGCDCFGCCELPAGSGNHVWIGSASQACDLAGALDPTKCEPCEPVTGCLNGCDPCEICIGKGAVAPGCSAQDQCAPGIQPCGLPGQDCCPANTYCVTGCCQPNLL